MDKDCVFQNLNCDTIYDVPIMLERQNLSAKVCERLGIDAREPDLTEWNEIVKKSKEFGQKGQDCSCR